MSQTTTPPMTTAQAEAHFRNGGTVSRRYRNMPISFETPAGKITRAVVNLLYGQGKLTATPAGIGATYSWRAE